MIENILYIIGIWCLIGFVTAFIDLYVYFRGMKHMIHCYVSHKDPIIAHIGYQMLLRYISNSFILHFAFFLIYTLIGPFTILVLIFDFFRFSFAEK